MFHCTPIGENWRVGVTCWSAPLRGGAATPPGATMGLTKPQATSSDPASTCLALLLRELVVVECFRAFQAHELARLPCSLCGRHCRLYGKAPIPCHDASHPPRGMARDSEEGGTRCVWTKD